MMEAAPTIADPSPAPEVTAPAPAPAAPAAAPASAARPPLATGGQATEPAPVDDKPAAQAYWPNDWREKLAEHTAAGDSKAYQRELKRLQRISDPNGIYGMYREMESRFDRGGLVKVPGEGASKEDIAAWNKSVGVPEKPDGYLDGLKLENGAVLGDNDKKMLSAFAQELHAVGAPPSAFNKAVDWYFKQQEENAAAIDEADDSFRQQALSTLKDEFGPAFQRSINSISSLFAAAPGGTDVKNAGALMNRLLGGRTADGKIIGNDPEITKWLVAIATDINPAATVVEEGGDMTGDGIKSELAKIEKTMRSDRQAYNKDEAMQKRYRELLTAQEKMLARNRNA